MTSRWSARFATALSGRAKETTDLGKPSLLLLVHARDGGWHWNRRWNRGGLNWYGNRNWHGLHRSRNRRDTRDWSWFSKSRVNYRRNSVKSRINRWWHSRPAGDDHDFRDVSNFTGIELHLHIGVFGRNNLHGSRQGKNLVGTGTSSGNRFKKRGICHRGLHPFARLVGGSHHGGCAGRGRTRSTQRIKIATERAVHILKGTTRNQKQRGGSGNKNHGGFHVATLPHTTLRVNGFPWRAHSQALPRAVNPQSAPALTNAEFFAQLVLNVADLTSLESVITNSLKGAH